VLGRQEEEAQRRVEAEELLVPARRLLVLHKLLDRVEKVGARGDVGGRVGVGGGIEALKRPLPPPIGEESRRASTHRIVCEGR
jgi:hypothetical protein